MQEHRNHLSDARLLKDPAWLKMKSRKSEKHSICSTLMVLGWLIRRNSKQPCRVWGLKAKTLQSIRWLLTWTHRKTNKESTLTSSLMLSQPNWVTKRLRKVLPEYSICSMMTSLELSTFTTWGELPKSWEKRCPQMSWRRCWRELRAMEMRSLSKTSISSWPRRPLLELIYL